MTLHSRDLRILFATNHAYLPQRVGGSELVTHDLCLALSQAGYSVAVLCSLEAKGFVYALNRIRAWLYNDRNFPRDRLCGYPVFRGWHPPQGVMEVTRAFMPSVAVVQAGSPMKLVEPLLDTRIPTIMYLHDVDFDPIGREFTQNPLLGFLANSRFTASRASMAFGIKSPPVVYPLVMRERYSTPTSRECVVFVGSYPEKGIDIAFQLAEARKDIPFEFIESWTLSSETFEKYRQKAAALGNVVIRRHTLNMREVYRKAKILLVPSQCEEAWGRVVTEAQFSGIPVLASNIGGLPESVGPGGILVDPTAPLSNWVAALSVMWDDAAQYNQLVKATLSYSNRKEIQRDAICDRFVAALDTFLIRAQGAPFHSLANCS